MPKSSYVHLAAFKDRRRESIPHEKKTGPFKSKSMRAAKEFAQILCQALKDEGLDIISENEDQQRLCKITTKTKLGYEFRVQLDACIPANQSVRVGIEIKYMEAGIFFIPDTKKIAYDYLHLQKTHPRMVYIVVSGGRIAKSRKSEDKIRNMLVSFSDYFFDLDLEQEGSERQYAKLVHLLRRLSKDSRKENNLNKIPSRLVDTRYFGTPSGGDKKASHPEAIKLGNEFEARVKKKLLEQNIPFSPMKGAVYTPNEVFSGREKKTIELEGDIYIPSHNSPTYILECKNMQRLSRPFLSSLCFDAWHFKKKFKDVKYYAILGSKTKPFPTGFVDGYVDGLVYSDGLDSFIEYIGTQKL